MPYVLCSYEFQKTYAGWTLGLKRMISDTFKAHFKKIKFLSNEALKDAGQAPKFQIMAASDQLEPFIGTALLEFEVIDSEFQEDFIVRFKKRTN